LAEGRIRDGRDRDTFAQEEHPDPGHGYPSTAFAGPDRGGRPVFTNAVRIGYARISTRAQDHQAQLDTLAAADYREVVVEIAIIRSDRPKLHATLKTLKPGDTLVIYKPDRIARSMKCVPQPPGTAARTPTPLTRHSRIRPVNHEAAPA
jgi:hypothetical protein